MTNEEALLIIVAMLQRDYYAKDREVEAVRHVSKVLERMELIERILKGDEEE